MNDEIDTDRIAAEIRASIIRQLETTKSGKAIAAAVDPAVLANFLSNVVGNLSYTVASFVEDATQKAE